MNTVTYSAPGGLKEISRAVSEANPRVKEEQRYAPRQGLQNFPAPLPLPGRIRQLQYALWKDAGSLGEA